MREKQIPQESIRLLNTLIRLKDLEASHRGKDRGSWIWMVCNMYRH
jgi:hypothetical protein